MDATLNAVSVAPEIVDGALAVVVNETSGAMAVWKGRSRIDLFALDGAWHEAAGLGQAGEHGTWAREEVLAFSVRALTAALANTERSPSEPSRSAPAPGQNLLRIGVEELRRAWLVRARAKGYTLWDGTGVVGVYDSDGLRRQQVRVTPADLASLSRLMHDLLATAGRGEDAPVLA
jgi:hypothetical protein